MRVGLGWVLYLKENNYPQTKRPTLNHSASTTELRFGFVTPENGAKPLQFVILYEKSHDMDTAMLSTSLRQQGQGDSPEFRRS